MRSSMHTTSLYNNLKIMKFEKLNNVLTDILMLKINNDFLLTFLKSLSIVNEEIHTYKTRHSHDSYIYNYNNNVTLFPIKCHGPKIWYSVPLSIQ